MPWPDSGPNDTRNRRDRPLAPSPNEAIPLQTSAIVALSRRASSRAARPVTPEIAGSSPVAPVSEPPGSGRLFTSRSTTTPASPTPSCSEARAPPTASRSSAARSSGMPTRRSGSSASSPTTATATASSPAVTSAPSSGSAAAYTRPRRPQTNGCKSRGRFRLGPLPGSCRCCLCVTRPNGWLVSMPLL